MTRKSCTLFQQQTLLITCNMPAQQTTGTVPYGWVKTTQLRSSHSFTRGVLPVRNTTWNQNIPQKCACFRQAETESRQLSCPPSSSAAWRSWSPGGVSLTCSSPLQLLTCLQVFDKVTCQAAPELRFPKSPRLLSRLAEHRGPPGPPLPC